MLTSVIVVQMPTVQSTISIFSAPSVIALSIYRRKSDEPSFAAKNTINVVHMRRNDPRKVFAREESRSFAVNGLCFTSRLASFVKKI